MAKICFLGCLDIQTRTVTALTIESAIRAFAPDLLVFADSPWISLTRADPVAGAAIPGESLAPKTLVIDLKEARARLRAMKYLETEASARKRLEALKERGLLDTEECALLDGIEESRMIFKEVFEASLMAQNDPAFCGRVMATEKRARADLIAILKRRRGGAESSDDLESIDSAVEERRRALFEACMEAARGEPGKILYVCGLPEKAAFISFIGSSVAMRGHSLAEFWE